MDHPKKSIDPLKNPRGRKALVHEQGPRRDEKKQTFRGEKRSRIRGRTEGTSSS